MTVVLLALLATVAVAWLIIAAALLRELRRDKRDDAA